MVDRYIVSSPGRVASHIVVGMIQRAGKQAIHTHYPFYKTDDDSITGLVLVSRHNLFDAIMSNILVVATGQTTEYTNTNFDKFNATKGEFTRQYNWFKNYSDNHDFSRPYGEIKTIYFEDFINNYSHVLDILGLVDQSAGPEFNANFTKKAPYSYQDLIINIDQCRQWYDELEMVIYSVQFTENDFINLSEAERNLSWSGELII
jgi:hypothetical protein